MLLLAALLSWTAAAAESEAGATDKIRLLLVHGGHDFETNQFLAMFRANKEVTFTAVEHPKAQAWFTPDRAQEYDVLVFYDMWQNISEEAKAGLTAVLKQGKGLVALHHCMASFPKWDEYANIIGGRYHSDKWMSNGVEKPASTYLHDVDFNVRIADRAHPVTRGLKDFAIHDETYGGFEVKSDSHVLLTTDHPTSGKSIAWSRNHGPARVVYIQLGHDHQAYENSSYRQLVSQAIRWAARRETP